MRSFTATDLANKTGDVLAAAAQGYVEIKRHGKARFVVLSVEKFESLRKNGDPRRAIHIDDMTGEEADELIALLDAELQND